MATISVAGFPAAQLTGDQAIFMDHPNATAGIWHFNSAQHVTVTNSVFAGDDLTTNIPANSVTGTSWAYATPFTLSSGHTLYFTSVQNMYYSQQATSGGAPFANSVTPSGGTQTANTTQIYTFAAGDTAGLSDLAGVDIQFRDKPNYPNACWLFFNPTTNTLAINSNGNWGEPAPIGSGGSTLTGDACTVNTASITTNRSANNITLTIPIQITVGDNNIWQIFTDAQNKEGVDAGYSQIGTVQAKPPSQGSFTLSVSPREMQAAPTGTSVNYIVSVTPANGFNEPITFGATSRPGQSGNTTQLSFAFNPSTLTDLSSTTTMTVTSTTSANPDNYTLVVTGAAQTYANSAQPGPLLLQNGPPQFTLSPTSGTGSSQTFTITWPDGGNSANSFNMLISPSLGGANACWLFIDLVSRKLYLASDDTSSWTYAYTLNDSFGDSTQGPGASNSQCAVVNFPGWDADSGFVTGIHSGHNTLTIPLTFTPAFNGTKTVYVRGSNAAGFDTGYQPLGGWTVP